MEKKILCDENLYPTQEIIFSYIGENSVFWKLLFDDIHGNRPELSEEWRFYNDGKTWLMKITKKTKTIFWLSLVEDTFRLTFYFNQRAEKELMDSDISEELKKSFFDSVYTNKIKGITIIARNIQDIEYAKILTGIKLKVK